MKLPHNCASKQVGPRARYGKTSPQLLETAPSTSTDSSLGLDILIWHRFGTERRKMPRRLPMHPHIDIK